MYGSNLVYLDPFMAPYYWSDMFRMLPTKMCFLFISMNHQSAIFLAYKQHRCEDLSVKSNKLSLCHKYALKGAPSNL